MLLLLHSCLLSPAGWTPTAEALADRSPGTRTLVPDLRSSIAGGPPYHERMADLAAEAVVAGETADLIAHSAAGALVPAVVARLGERVRGVVLVDARLPHPGVSWLDGLDPQRSGQLRESARDGRLPRWDTWFPVETIQRMLPSAMLRERVLENLPELPLALAEEPTPDVDLPASLPVGYVRLSTAYDAELATAQARGWPTRQLDTDHLAIATRPYDVAGAIEDVLAAFSRRR